MDRSDQIYQVSVRLREEDGPHTYNTLGWRSHPELGFLELQLSDGLRVLFINFEDIVWWEVPFIRVVENHEN